MADTTPVPSVHRRIHPAGLILQRLNRMTHGLNRPRQSIAGKADVPIRCQTKVSMTDGLDKPVQLLVQLLQHKQESHEEQTTGLPFYGRIEADDWQKIIEQARLHQVSPLLYYRLTTEHAIGNLSSQHLHALRNDFLNSSARSMYERSHLGKVLAAFRHRNIPVIVLKGAHLAEAIYPDPVLRRMNDIDLLIHTTDLPEAEKIMLKADYSYRSDPDRDKAWRSNISFVSSNGKLVFELHWHVIIPESRLNNDIDTFLTNSQSAVIAGQKVQVLCSEDLLLYQCYHTAKHLFEHYGLRSLYDIKLITEKQSDKLDWDAVISRAREWGVEKSVFICLTMVHHLFGVSVEDSILKQIHPKELDERMRRSAFQLMFRSHDPEPTAPLTDNIGKMLNRSRSIDKAAVLFKRLFPPRREMNLVYHIPSDSPWWWCFYPYRIFDLLIRYRRTLLLLMGRNPSMLIFLQRKKKIHEMRRWLELYEEDFL